jgi:hypothetical protein
MLNCELCGRSTPIRSRLKSGEFSGKKVCQYCRAKNTPKKAIKAKIFKRKVFKKREVSYSDFFDKAIKEMQQNPFCENCGGRININYLPHHNVAHILPKQRFKSVATHDSNKMFLCAGKDGLKSCHEQFDSGYSTMMEMPVFEIAKKRFEIFKDEITEKGKLFHIFTDN